MNGLNAHSPEITMTDLMSAQVVEVEFDDMNRVWVNVDGKCLLRIGRVELPPLIHVHRKHFPAEKTSNGSGSGHVEKNGNEIGKAGQKHSAGESSK